MRDRHAIRRGRHLADIDSAKPCTLQGFAQLRSGPCFAAGRRRQQGEIESHCSRGRDPIVVQHQFEQSDATVFDKRRMNSF